MKVCFPKIFKDFFWGLGGIGMLVAGGRLGSLQILGELPIGLQQVRHWGVKRLVSVRANQSKYYWKEGKYLKQYQKYSWVNIGKTFQPVWCWVVKRVGRGKGNQSESRWHSQIFSSIWQPLHRKVKVRNISSGFPHFAYNLPRPWCFLSLCHHFYPNWVIAFVSQCSCKIFCQVKNGKLLQQEVHNMNS